MTMTTEQIETVVHCMSRLNDRQKDYFLRYVRRLHDDPAFFGRTERESTIFKTLLAAEDFRGLDRWFSRGALTLVKQTPGEIQ